MPKTKMLPKACTFMKLPYHLMRNPRIFLDQVIRDLESDNVSGIDPARVVHFEPFVLLPDTPTEDSAFTSA